MGYILSESVGKAKGILKFIREDGGGCLLHKDSEFAVFYDEGDYWLMDYENKVWGLVTSKEWEFLLFLSNCFLTRNFVYEWGDEHGMGDRLMKTVQLTKMDPISKVDCDGEEMIHGPMPTWDNIINELMRPSWNQFREENFGKGN